MTNSSNQNTQEPLLNVPKTIENKDHEMNRMRRQMKMVSTPKIISMQDANNLSKTLSYKEGKIKNLKHQVKEAKASI